MDYKKHRTKSIDGFYGTYRPSPRPAFREDSLDNITRPEKPVVPKPAVAKARVPKVAPSYAIPQQKGPSLVGMNMPTQNYAKDRSTKSATKHKWVHSFKRPWTRKRKVVTTILSIAVVFLAIFGWFGSRLISSIDKVFHGNIFSDVQALFSQANLKESNGRVNILVAGDSSDDPGHDGAVLTDSIMVMSIDPTTHTGFMFSIPRDLWVYIPGLNSYQKINAADDVTTFNQSGYPSGGMGELQQIVQNDLGIPIDYYALVNYQAVREAVDDVGGITIDINSPDPRGLYDSYTNLKLPNGEDTLTGQEALNLSRARCDSVVGDVCYGFPASDFTRTMYQREIVEAILKKALTAGVIANPLKITSLFSSFANNVQTNLSLQDVLTLDQTLKGLNFSKLGSYTYSNSVSGNTNPLLSSAYTSGQDSLVPTDGIGNYEGLKAYWKQISSSSALSKENASIEILNGTNVSGLALTAEEKLQNGGVSSTAIADAYGNYSQTVIVDNTNGKDPATKSLLQELFPGSVVTSTSSSEASQAKNYSDSFVVILGQNYANSASGSSTSNYSNTGSSTASYTGSASSTTN